MLVRKITDQIDEDDPVFGEAEAYTEAYNYAHLKALEESIEDVELEAHLEAQGE